MRPDRAFKAILIVKLARSILLLVALTSVAKAEDDLSAAPSTLRDGDTGVVLLQDGGMLTGQITHVANSYVVGRAGGLMQIPAARVKFVGQSQHDAYEYRAKHLNQQTPEQHLALAEWCLRYNLFDDAAVELDVAKSLGAAEPKLGLLNRRLTVAKEQPARTAAATSRVAAQPLAPAVVKPATAKTKLPATVPDLPDGVLELFTRKVQPVLVNSCTVSKCHESGGHQAFQLNRALLRGEANRRSTMQNLAATLALIDREHPEASKLLTVPRQTHGGLNGPIFGPRQDQAFRHLAEWVALVEPSKASIDTAPNPSEQEAVAVTAPSVKRVPRSVTPSRVATAGYEQPIVKDAAEVGPPAESAGAPAAEDAAVPPTSVPDDGITTLMTPHRLKYGGKLESRKPRDEFDPEIFNRRNRAQPQQMQLPIQPAR